MAVVILAGLYAAQHSCADSPLGPVKRDETTTATAVTADSLTYVRMPAGQTGQLINYTGFDVNFNADRHVPNYVVWTLTRETANGTVADRKDSDFRPDDRVYGSAQISDYKASGYDRGHMAPAADMKWSKQAMDDCHLFTNIVPQSNGLNRGPWQTVESNCRNWAERFGRIVIICGPVLSDHTTATIGKTGVTVPERFFKVVLAPDADPPMGIGFLMSNYDFAGGAQSMAVSIDQVEAATGYDFFSTLPDQIENDVESQCNYSSWQRKGRRR